MKIKKIYVFGNPLVPEDSLPFQFINELSQRFPQVNFIIVDPNDNFPPKNEKKLIILDIVIGIEVPLILNLQDLENKKKTPISPHDYDLLMHLLLMKKLKKVDDIKIIGVPKKKNIPMSKLILLIKSLIANYK